MKNHYLLYRRALIVVASILALTCFILSLLYLYETSVEASNITRFVAFLIKDWPIFSVDSGLLLIALLFMVVFGIPQLMVAVFVFLRMKKGLEIAVIVSSYFIVFGVSMFFITKLYAFVAFFLWLSICELVLALLANVDYYKYHYSFDINSYKKIGTFQEIAVIYYNANPFIKKHAYDVADELRGQIYEIELDENEDIKPLDLNFDKLRTLHIICDIEDDLISLPVQLFIEDNKNKNIKIYYEFVTDKKYSDDELKILLKNIKKYDKMLYTKLYYGVVASRRQI